MQAIEDKPNGRRKHIMTEKREDRLDPARQVSAREAIIRRDMGIVERELFGEHFRLMPATGGRLILHYGVHRPVFEFYKIGDPLTDWMRALATCRRKTLKREQKQKQTNAALAANPCPLIAEDEIK